MSIIIRETTAEKSLSDEILLDEQTCVGPYLTARNITRCYSLLSSDRHRLICVFDAPDVESVQDAYDEAGLFSRSIWAGLVVQPEGAIPPWNESTLKVQESTYPMGFTDEQCSQERKYLLPCYAEYGVEWIRSYVSLDRTRVLCELNAPDAELIRYAHHKFGFSLDRVWSAQVFCP